MRRKLLMFGIPVLAMVVIAAVSFTVALTPVVYGTKQPDGTPTLSPTPTVEATATPTPTTTVTQAASPTPIASPSPAPSFEIIISPKTVMSNENISVTVIAPPGAKNVNIIGQNFTLKKELEQENETTWKGEIIAPRKAGKYDIAVYVDGDKNETSFEVVPPSPIWKRFWWLLIPLIGIFIAGGVLIFLWISSKENESSKLGVQVRNEKGKGLKGIKVIADWEGGIPKSKRTNEIGWVEFEVPVGAWCEIKAEKEGYGAGKAEIRVKRGGSKVYIDLESAEQVQKFLEVNVVDEKGKEVKGARVGILRGNKVLTDGKTKEFGYCNLEMPKGKGQAYIFAEKEGYEKATQPISREQPPIKLLVKIKRKLAELKLEVLDEDKNPLSEAEVKIDDNKEFSTDLRGGVRGKVSWGEHELRITKEGYEPYEGTLNVEGDTSREINLTTKSGTLKVTVVDKETGEPVEGIKVDVKGTVKKTNKEGFVNFDKVPVGTQKIEVSDPKDVYSSEPKKVEIKEKITTPTEIKLSSSFEILDKDILEDLEEAHNNLKYQRGRLPKTAYDCYLPDYYMKIGEKLVEIVNNPGKNRKLLRLIRGDFKNPKLFMKNLADVIGDACEKIGEGVKEKKNEDIFGDVKRFVVDKGLAKANVEVELKDAESEDIKKYIERGKGGAEKLLREVDQALTKTAGNIYPMSVLFKVARQIMNSDASADDKAKALVASVILDYVKVMLKDDNVEERLRGLIT